MAIVKFLRGVQAKYDAQVHAGAIYFATDTGKIFVDGKLYGSDDDVKVVDVVESNEGTTKKLTISFSNGTVKEISFAQPAKVSQTADGLMSKEDKVILDNLKNDYDDYASAMDDTLATVNAIGGIPAGTTAESLKAKTISQVLDDLLFPTVNPTITEPSVSGFALTNYTSPALVGSAAPTASNFTVTPNRGSIKIANKEQNKRAGEVTGTEIKYAGSTSLPAKVVEGTMTYTAEVSFAEGPQPKDSKGGNYGSPLAACVKSKTCNVVGVYPYFANVQNAAASQLALTAGTELTIEFAAEGPNKHMFKLPAHYIFTSSQLLNTLSGQYEAFDKNKFTVSTETIQVSGEDVAYKVYTRNDAGFNGASTFKIKFSK